jgi:hypothetical protein
MPYWNFNSTPTQLQHYFHAFSSFLNISPTHAINKETNKINGIEIDHQSIKKNVYIYIYIPSKLDTVLYHIIESLRWVVGVDQIMADGCFSSHGTCTSEINALSLSLALFTEYWIFGRKRKYSGKAYN